MSKAGAFRSHARITAFVGVLVVTSGLATLLLQDARAINVQYVSPPNTVATTSTTSFTVDVTVPSNERIPITSVEVALEQRNPSRTDKVSPILIGVARCPMIGNIGQGCPTNEPIQRRDGVVTWLTSVTFSAAFQRNTGTSINTGYFGYGVLSGTRTGYGYDTVSPQIGGGQTGYGYGYEHNDRSAFNIGDGYGYGYADGGLTLRFTVVVSGATLTAGTTYFLTTVLNTGSGVIGDLSSPFTEFQANTPGGGGSGSGGGGGAAGGAITVTPTVSGRTATAAITGSSGTVVNVPLTALNAALGTLTLTLAKDVTNAQVTVTTSDTPTEGATAIPTGFGSFLYLSINAPSGAVSGGQLTFTLTPAQLGPNAPASVALLHFVNNAWTSLTTTAGATTAAGTTFTATMPSFSPFAIVFDQAPPAVSNLRPPEGSSATTRPLIAASLADNRGINTAVTRMLVDGQAVAATVTASEILYTPAVALSLGTHTVTVQATDVSGFTANRTWTFNAAQAADSVAPTVTPKSPARDGFTNNPRPAIAADYSDNLGIDTTKVTVSIDGAPAASPTITPTGVSVTPAVGLTDGRHTVTVTVADTSGNSNFATWSFTVDTALPTFAAIEPAEGAVTGPRPTIRATYADALSGIDTAKVVMMLDGQAVAAQAAAGSATFTPPGDLKAGSHTVKVDVTDMAGNTASRTWTFTSGAGGDNFLIVLVLIALIVVGGVGYWYWSTKMKK